MRHSETIAGALWSGGEKSLRNVDVDTPIAAAMAPQ
jgi:hypothetical protein